MRTLARFVFNLIGTMWAIAFVTHDHFLWFESAGDITTLIVAVQFLTLAEVVGKKDA